MGNLVSSCGSPPSGISTAPANAPAKAPAKANVKVNAPANAPAKANVKVNAPANAPENVKANIKTNTLPLKKNKTGPFNGNDSTPSDIRFKETVNVKEIPSRRELPINNSLPSNMETMEMGSQTKNAVKSAMKPNTRTNNEKKEAINPNKDVLGKSINTALLRGASEGKLSTKNNVADLLFSEENIPSMTGGRRRTKKQRKNRKH